jgi:hypothetical protein
MDANHDTIPIQPRPVDCDVTHTWNDAGCVTGIMRDWRPGDSSRCRLCPLDKCTARGRDHCIVAVAEFVPPDSAPLLSLAGRNWVHSGGAWVHADGHRGVALP